MTSVFDIQQKQVSQFYDFLTNQKKEQNETFSKLVNTLNRNKGVVDLLSKSFDEMVESIFPEFNEYLKNVQSMPTDSDIKYYDYNKKEFINKVEFNNCVFVKDYNFVLKKMSTKKEDFSLMPTNACSCLLSNNHPALHTMLQIGCCNKNASCTLYNRDTTSLKKKFMNITQPSVLLVKSNQMDSYTETLKTNLNIKLDNYLNIYIPRIKTYIIVNYSPFPLASFYLSKDIFDVNEIICYNEQCPTDNEEFNYMKEFVDNLGTFSSNLDVKQTFIDTRFEQLFTFFEYENKRDNIKPFQKLSEVIFNMLPNKPVIDSNIDEEDEEVIDPETNAKIIELREKLQNKELVNSILEDKISKDIERSSKLEKKLLQNNNFIEELNNKIIALMDENLVIKKRNLEIIKLKDSNSEVKTQLDDLIKENTQIICDKDKIQQEYEKYESINKHMAQQILDNNNRETNRMKTMEDKIDDITKKEQLILKKNNTISKLETKLIEVQNETKEELNKLNKFIKKQQTLNEDSKKNKEYENFLLEKYNISTELIKQLKQTIEKQNKELKIKNSEITKVKKNIMRMIS